MPEFAKLKFRRLLKAEKACLSNSFFFYFSVFFIFLASNVVTSFDSAWYHKYKEIMFGSLSWSEWDYVRGITFPIFLQLTHTFFGKSHLGVLLSLSIVHVLTVYCYDKFLQNQIVASIRRRLFLILFFIFNSVYQGYSHALLTEPLYFLFQIIYIQLLSNKTFNPRDNLSRLVLTSILLTFTYQLKESYILNLLLISFAFTVFDAIQNKKNAFSLAALNALPFALAFLFSKLILLSIEAKTKKPPTPVSHNFLIAGITYGSLRGSTLDQKRTKWDFITSLQIIKSSNDDCWVKNKSGEMYEFKTPTKTISCPTPTNIYQALSIRLFLLTHLGFKPIKHQFKILMESISIEPNRFNENTLISLRSFESAKGRLSNVIEIEGNPIYQRYVSQYKASTNLAKGLIGEFFLIIAPLSHLLTTSALGLCLLLLPFVFVQYINNQNAASRLILASGATVLCNFFLGMTIDRYMFSTYPVAMLALILLVDNMFNYFFKSLNNENN